MTTAFVDAAAAMARANGLPDYGFPVIDHPVSSATDEALLARARAVCDWIRRELKAQ